MRTPTWSEQSAPGTTGWTAATAAADPAWSAVTRVASATTWTVQSYQTLLLRPELESIGPLSITTGTTVDAAVGGRFFTSDITVTVSGTSVTASTYTLIDSYRLVFQLTATNSAAIGSRTVQVETYGGTSNQLSLTVEAPVNPYIVQDTFSGSAVELTAHTGEWGATWTKSPANGGGTIITTGNTIYGAGASPGWPQLYYASGTPPDADYEVEGTIVFKTLTGSFGGESQAGILARFSTTANSGYFLLATPTAIRLYKVTNGSYSQLGSDVATSWTLDQEYKLRLRCVGTTLTGYLDDVQIIQRTDSTYANAGVVGVLFFNFTIGSPSTGCQITQLLASDV